MITRRGLLKSTAALGATAALAPFPWRANGQEPLKIGVAYVSPIAEIGWTKQHSLGVEAIKETFGDKVEIRLLDNIFQPQDAERVFREFAATGSRLIFGTSFSHGSPLQRVAPQFPEVAFEQCSGLIHLPNLGTFEAKYYEGTFLAGVAAAKVTQSGKIGLIGGFPIPATLGPANSLLLGAQSVNPDITCTALFLNSWYDPAKEKESAQTLISQGCDVICSITDTPTGVQVAEENGVWGIGYASDMSAFAPTKHLTAFMLDWTSEYVGSTQLVLDGAWTSRVRWSGLKEGIVKMAPYNPALSQEALAVLAEKEAAIVAGTLHPYAGELRDQAGEVRVGTGSVLDEPGIRGMNWFVQGMIGSLR